MNEEKLVPISDMYLVAALLDYGVEIDHIDKSNPSRVEFYFVNKSLTIWQYYKKEDGKFGVTEIEMADINQVKIPFYSSKLMFLPTYFKTIKDVKSMLHSKN